MDFEKGKTLPACLSAKQPGRLLQKERERSYFPCRIYVCVHKHRVARPPRPPLTVFEGIKLLHPTATDPASILGK